MSLLDDIRKDRDAGTDGPWQVSGVRGRFEGKGHQVDAPSLAGVAWVGYEAAEHASCWSDVRRIARVPQMEAALLAADELAKTAERMGEGAHHHEVKKSSLPDPQVMLDKPVFDAVFAALAAYRAAIEAP